MNTISEEEIDFITNDLCARGVTDQLLRDQLVDHICCILEQEELVTGDYHFAKSYQQFICELDNKKITGLQRDFWMATNIPLQNLKRISFMILGLSISLLIAWLLVRIEFPVFGAVGFSIGILLLLTVCLPVAWYIFHLRYRETSHHRWITIGGIFSGTLLLGILSRYWDVGNGSVIVDGIVIFFLTISAPIFLFGSVRKRLSTTSLLCFLLFILVASFCGYWLFQERLPGFPN